MAVPVIVTDYAGRLVRGLSPSDFAQTNIAAQAWLPHVRRIGNIVDGMLAGAHGDATVISFNDEVNVVAGVADLKASGDKSRCPGCRGNPR